MSPTAVPYTVTYRCPGTEPPVFLAGNFTALEWGLQEMGSRQEGGEYVFESRVFIEPGREYHFKFKAGREGPWLLDENRATATDESGNRNNVLTLPKTYVSKIKDDEGRRTSTPIEQVASVAAEVADVASKLDKDDTSSPRISGSGGESEIDEDLKTPLFAHECFGAYEFVDDALDHDALDDSKLHQDSKPKLPEYDIDDVDMNDPTIEQFPSDKSSIFSTLRKIQSSLSEDQAVIDDQQPSPRLDARRSSVDSDDSLLSAGSLSPVSARKRENRMSTSSGRNRSLVSLGSIAEEPKTPGPEDASHPMATSSYLKKDTGRAKSPTIEQGEHLMMK